ncbi:hypothetical protein SDJN02_09836, partial [Cucurbita argyrosperma subsp. argyrosperma]
MSEVARDHVLHLLVWIKLAYGSILLRNRRCALILRWMFETNLHLMHPTEKVVAGGGAIWARHRTYRSATISVSFSLPLGSTAFSINWQCNKASQPAEANAFSSSHNYWFLHSLSLSACTEQLQQAKEDHTPLNP